MEVQNNLKVIDINVFISYKTNDDTQDLDTKTTNLLSSMFVGIDKLKRNKKNFKKNGSTILKNHKLQNKKENISNKVNLILNKLSESNIDSLVIEFLENINQVDAEGFEEIQKTFYTKIIGEINFVKIYLQFLKLITFIYNKVQSYNLEFLISTVESKYKLDYSDFDIVPDSKFEFVRDLDGEQKRINNLILIKNMVEQKILSEDIIKYCDTTILLQNLFLPDIYHWFNSRNRELTESEINAVKNLLKKEKITPRETVLLENLVNKKHVVNTEQTPIVDKQSTTPTKQVVNLNNIKPQSTNTVPEKVVKIKTDTLNLECENIMEEYMIVKSIDDIKYFIETRCIDAISKNKFCEHLLDKYFMVGKEDSSDLIDLMKQLIKTHILYKSNLSRGLLLINNNWKENSVEYKKPTEKLKTLLQTLKSIGITKSIEFLFEQYKIPINQA